MADAVIDDLVEQIISCEAFGMVGFTGGEPLLRPQTVCRAGFRLQERGLRWGVTTGLGWTARSAKAFTLANDLVRSGIASLNLSFDRSHGSINRMPAVKAFLGPVVQSGASVTIAVTGEQPNASGEVGEALTHLRQSFPTIRIEWHYTAPVGYAAGSNSINKTINRSNDICPLVNGVTLSVWPNGDIYPCCSTYVVNKNEELAFGNIARDSLEHMLQKVLKDNYIQFITKHGILALIGAVDQETWADVFDETPLDGCHVCSMISRSPTKIEELRSKIPK